MIGPIELGIGLMELEIGLRIDNARRTVLARVSGLVFLELHFSKEIWTVILSKMMK